MTDCKSTEVIWTEASQFWVPPFFVMDVLEIVSETFAVVTLFCGFGL